MLPIELDIENFMSHCKSVIDFTSFSIALIVAKERNSIKHSNGVGKSTIFKAIDYVLFDEYKCKSIDKIIRDGASACKVSFTFEVDGEKYKAIRGRSKSGSNLKLERWVVDKWESIQCKTNTQTQAELMKIIKIGYVAFKNSILFAQGDLDGIPFANPNARKELLKEPLQIVNYSKFHKIAKKKYDAVIKEVEKHQFLIDNLGNPQKDIDAICIELENVKEKLNIFLEKRTNIQSQLDIKNAKVLDLQKVISSDVSDANSQLNTIKINKKELQTDLARTQKELTESISVLKKYKETLSEKLTSLQTKQDNLKKLQSEPLRSLDVIQKDLDDIITKEQSGRVYIASLESRKQQLSKPIPDSGECNHCLQPIVDREGCIKKAKIELEETNQNLEKYTVLLNKCLKKRGLLEQEQRDTSKKYALLDSIQLDIANWKSIVNTHQASIIEYENIVELKKKNVSKLTNSLNILLEREENLKQIIEKSNIKSITDDILKLKNDIKLIENERENIISETSSLNTMINVLQDRKSKREDDLVKFNEFESKKKELEKEVLARTKVVKAFSSNGIPTLIINTILDDLQIEVNTLLSELRPDIQCQFIVDDEKDTWDIIFKIKGKERDVNLISGGQKLYIALSFKLALSRVIQNRLGVDIRFLELDEVDQPLDDAGIEALADIIRKWSKDFKILVITHNKLLTSKFDHFIVVEGNEEEGAKAYSTNEWIL